MEVIYLQVFVSFGLVVASLLLFAFSARQRDLDHVDRLALFPLEEDDAAAGRASASVVAERQAAASAPAEGT